MITDTEKQIIIDTLMPYKPKRIGIFGSYARGENTETSDIDILYDFEQTIGLFLLINIKEKLENLLGKPIDLVSEKYAHPKLKPLINKDLKIIYES